MRERDIFIEALQKPSPGDRAAYLHTACGPDADLLSRVERLLLEHHRQESFILDSPATALEAGLPLDADVLLTRPGTIIGRYKLLEPIGEGGYGSVFMAEQTTPVQRKVALKIIKAGMDTRQVIARFEAERQALALMDHPNIAKVFDAGVTDTGRPYFVMELVKGMAITKYCDKRHLTPRQRLELFVQVCQAVQHAHQKGIIHRDIKPTNVLVAQYDGKPVPKVIDFGVAKATGQKLTGRTMFTGFGDVIGTLEYMSPEQAGVNQLDVDTRSDIYSLGVLMYELLTGSTPLEKRGKKAALLEMLRVIREEEPPKPSTRLSTSEQLPSIAACRGLEPKKLSGLVHGELDWIVMKALEKDRGRRYDTANGFAKDVERYLNDDTVQACPPSAAYKLRKFARRNRGPVLAGGLVLLALVAGVTGTTIGMAQARRSAAAERVAKQQALADTVKARSAAEAEAKAKAQAQARLAQIQKGNEILTSVFADLNPDAEEEEGKPLRALLGERLLQAADQLKGEAVGDPEVVAGLQVELSRSLVGLGMAERAIPLLTEARATSTARLGPDHPGTLAIMHVLAAAYQLAGRSDLAVPLREETLELRKTRLGPGHQATLASMGGLAWAYLDAGRLDQAVPLKEETLKLTKAKLGPDHYNTLVAMNNLAVGYQAAGKLDLAVPLAEQTLELRKAKLGPDHPATLDTRRLLATAYEAVGKADLALPLHEETLRLSKAKLGPDHPATLGSMHSLAWGYQLAGKLDRAVPLFEETLRLSKAKLGPDHPGTLMCMSNLATAYQRSGKLDLAVPLAEQTLGLRKAKLGPDHPATLVTMNSLAIAYKAAGKLDLAVSLHEETLKLSKAKLGPDHPETLRSLSNLATAYQEAGKPEVALPLAQEAAVVIEKRRFRDQHADATVGMLIRCHEGLKQFDRAEAWRRKWLTVVKEQSGPDSAAYAQELAGLGSNLLQQRKWDEAKAVLSEAIRLRPDDHGSHYSLGSVYAYVGEWEKAAGAFEGAAKRAPDDIWSAYRWANLCLYTNDLEGYRRACRALLGRFDQTKNVHVADCTAKACALAPGFGGDADKVMRLADFAVTETEADPARKWFEITKGLVDYRAGRFRPAAEMILRSAPSDEGSHRDAFAFSILALAQHRQGRAAEAGDALASAQRIIATKMPKLEKGDTFGDDWHDWLHAQILCREADQLLNGPPASTQKSQ